MPKRITKDEAETLKSLDVIQFYGYNHEPAIAPLKFLECDYYLYIPTYPYRYCYCYYKLK